MRHRRRPFAAGPASADTSASALRCRRAAAAACRCRRARRASRNTNRLSRCRSATTIAEARSISMPPYCSGTRIGRQAQFRGFAQDAIGDAGLLMLDRFEVRRHFVVPELFRGARDGAMLFGEILGREYRSGCALRSETRRLPRSCVASYLSKIPAAPCPPPTHIVTMPYRASRRFISRRMVAVSLAPVHPSGWPSAMAPPLTLTLSRIETSLRGSPPAPARRRLRSIRSRRCRPA